MSCNVIGCDGGGWKIEKELRVLPLNGDSNLILCYPCYCREIEHRKYVNKRLGLIQRWDLTTWEDLKIYDPGE